MILGFGIDCFWFMDYEGWHLRIEHGSTRPRNLLKDVTLNYFKGTYTLPSALPNGRCFLSPSPSPDIRVSILRFHIKNNVIWIQMCH